MSVAFILRPLTLAVGAGTHMAGMIRARFPCLPALLFVLAPAAHAAHPLITEDTATQGTGNIQLEITNEQGALRAADSRQYAVLTTTILSYGIIDTVDVRLAAPYLRLGTSSPDGTPGVSGWTDTGLDLKWRFYQDGPISLALIPGVTFPTGDDSRGLGVGEYTGSLFAVASYATAPWTFHLHVGHQHHNKTQTQRADVSHVSVAAVRQHEESLQLVVDAGVDTNADLEGDYRLWFATVGAIWSVRSNLDLDAGYRVRRGDTTESGIVLAGITVRW